MSVGTVASRYAKSLIELAGERKVVDDVYNDMLFLKTLTFENPGVMLALSSPLVRHDKKLAVLNKLFKSRVNPVSYSIFEIITRKNREGILDSIADEFVRQYDVLKGIQKVTVISSVALTPAIKKTLIESITKQVGLDTTVELEEKIDPALIGGYILRIGDRQIDASVKTRLKDLKLELSH